MRGRALQPDQVVLDGRLAVGFMVGRPDVVAALAKLKSYLDYGTFQPIQIASIVALREASDYPAEVCEIYRLRRDALCRGLARAGWQVEPPHGTMFVWAQIPDRFRELGSLEFALLLAREANVAVSPGIGFGDGRRRARPLRARRERAADRPGDPRRSEAAANADATLAHVVRAPSEAEPTRRRRTWRRRRSRSGAAAATTRRGAARELLLRRARGRARALSTSITIGVAVADEPRSGRRGTPPARCGRPSVRASRPRSGRR